MRPASIVYHFALPFWFKCHFYSFLPHLAVSESAPLELHGVESLSLLEGEAGGHVGLEHGSLLDDGNELSIEAGLESLALGSNLSLVFFSVGSSEHGNLLGSALAFSLLESGIGDAFVNLDTGNVNLGLGGNDVGLIDTLDRDTVDLVGSSDEQQAALQLLQENDTATSETASKQDQNGTGSDRRAQLDHFWWLVIRE